MRNTKKIKIQQEMKAQKAFEPIWESEDLCPSSVVLRTIYWYHENKTERDASRYLKCEPSIAKNHTTYAWVTRMASRGFKFSETETLTVDRLKEGFERENTRAKQQKTPAAQATATISIQDRLQNKIDEYIGELEGFVDDYGIRGSNKDMNAYQWMTDNGVKAAHATKIAEHFKKQALEISLAESGKDSDLSEGYEGYTKSRLKNILAVMSSIAKDAEKIGQNQKITRKPRKKKPVSHEKLVSKLNFKEKDDTLKIKSVNPLNLIGCKQVWVYNTKTRKLGRYTALDDSGISVKGSTLTGFSSDSIEKTLRKPQEIVPNVISAGKVQLRKLMEGINAKAGALTGRINRDVVILRVVS
jgi:hypothetical protein